MVAQSQKGDIIFTVLRYAAYHLFDFCCFSFVMYPLSSLQTILNYEVLFNNIFNNGGCLDGKNCSMLYFAPQLYTVTNYGRPM